MVETLTVVALIALGAALLGGIVYSEVLAHYERKREARFREEFLKRQVRK